MHAPSGHATEPGLNPGYKDDLDIVSGDRATGRLGIGLVDERVEIKGGGGAGGRAAVVPHLIR